MPQDTIGSWTSDQLLKAVREFINVNPPVHLASLTVDDLIVAGALTASGSVTYAQNDTFYVIGTSGMPAFLNSWVKGGSPYFDPAFIKTEDGWVRLRGAVKTGTVGQAAFNLPPGYRPASTSRHATVQNGAFGIVDIDNTGNVIPQTSNVLVSLDGIQFKAK